MLEFPDEILSMIVYQLPEQWNISQSCSKLYEISCNVKFFTLELKFDNCDEVSVRKNEISLIFPRIFQMFHWSICFNFQYINEELAELVISSKRRFRKIFINKKSIQKVRPVNGICMMPLIELAKKIGKDVKEIQIKEILGKFKFQSQLNSSIC